MHAHIYTCACTCARKQAYLRAHINKHQLSGATSSIFPDCMHGLYKVFAFSYTLLICNIAYMVCLRGIRLQ